MHFVLPCWLSCHISINPFLLNLIDFSNSGKNTKDIVTFCAFISKLSSWFLLKLQINFYTSLKSKSFDQLEREKIKSQLGYSVISGVHFRNILLEYIHFWKVNNDFSTFTMYPYCNGFEALNTCESELPSVPFLLCSPPQWLEFLNAAVSIAKIHIWKCKNKGG